MRRFRAFIVAFLVAAFVISMPARDGMAVMQIPYNTVVYGPLDIGGVFGLPVVEGVGVCAHDKYAAAMTALGYGGDVVTGLDADKRALLSNQSTGGAFWTFAQHFVNPSPNGNLTERMVYRYAELYGTGVVWSAEYQASEKASATDAFETILNGGSLGGGSGGDDGDYLTFFGNPVYVNKSVGRNPYFVNTQGVRYSNNVQSTYSLLPTQITVRIKGDRLTSFLESYSVTDYRYFIYIKNTNANNNLGIVNIYALDKSVTTTEKQNTVGNVGSMYIDSVSKLVGHVFTSTNLTYTYTDNVITVDLPDNVGSISTSNVGGFTSDGQLFLERGNGVAGPVIPPSNWPDEPDVPAPTAPEVPEPSEPERPVQPVNPTAPSLPDFPSNIISPGTTYETFDIQAILDAMDEHCQHLQSAIYQGFADYFDTFTPWLDERLELLQECIRGESVWQIQRIDADFESLKDYLHDLFEWLADQMDFTITGGDYDDSTVVSWLKKIYFKLGGASVNTKPVDPVGDPDGSWDWLNQLIEGILSALAGGAAALTGTLGELFQGIKDKFPFSIPWDIVAIVALLDAPPVTPAAVIEYDVFGAHVRYDIDLHFFDEQASVIRAMEDVLFCAFLLFKTDWLTGIFDGIGGFLGGKLKSTVKGA